MSVYEVYQKILRYETDGLARAEFLELMGEILRRGLFRNLQGHYGRTAFGLVRSGLLSPAGMVTPGGGRWIEEEPER